MGSKRNVDTVPHANRRDGAPRVEHFIHNRDGKIGERNSYGNDPFPPTG